MRTSWYNWFTTGFDVAKERQGAGKDEIATKDECQQTDLHQHAHIEKYRTTQAPMESVWHRRIRTEREEAKKLLCNKTYKN